MAITNSGPIKLSDLATEFSDTGTILLSEFYRGGSRVSGTPPANSTVPASGTIKLGNFYNTTRMLNSILYGASNYAFTPDGSTVYQQTGLYAGYGVPGDWSQANDGLIIYNGGYGTGSAKWTGKAFTVPAGCTDIRIKCTCDNGGSIYLNQTLIGGAPHTTWGYYNQAVVPGDILYVSLVNGGGSKYNGQVVRIDNLATGVNLLKTDTSWLGG